MPSKKFKLCYSKSLLFICSIPFFTLFNHTYYVASFVLFLCRLPFVSTDSFLYFLSHLFYAQGFEIYPINTTRDKFREHESPSSVLPCGLNPVNIEWHCREANQSFLMRTIKTSFSTLLTWLDYSVVFFCFSLLSSLTISGLFLPTSFHSPFHHPLAIHCAFFYCYRHFRVFFNGSPLRCHLLHIPFRLVFSLLFLLSLTSPDSVSWLLN